MSSIRTETETVIKKILPYLRRRGYDIETDLDFETPIKVTDRYSKGYADILVMCGEPRPLFIIEAKRSAKPLSSKDQKQAIEYGRALGCAFVVVTNGNDIRCFNVYNEKPVKWSGKLVEKIPTRAQISKVLSVFKNDKNAVDIILQSDTSLPFRPGLPLKQLNALFERCHNTIRKIEKDENNAFADFSKLLFLKLLEEKADNTLSLNDEMFHLPYSTRFHDLANFPETESDQVQTLIKDMIEKIQKQTDYGDVLNDPIRLRNPKTFHAIVKELSKVSFQDSTIDSKGAAFEYFVRATLKGKSLGQYFTPRPLIEMMSCLVGREKIINSLLAGSSIKVFDPACGTGGFIVFLMLENIRLLEERLRSRAITHKTYTELKEKLIKYVFFGSDANPGVAAAAKMNMIISGDGHTNIRAENSLSMSAKNWTTNRPDCHIILTNPPFGTSEAEALSSKDMSVFPLRSSKGQYLFLEKMILCTVADGDICSVIDDGILNTESAVELRRWLMKTCRLVAIVRLPEETFKPNKINVRTSVMYLQKREYEDLDYEDNYDVSFCDIKSLGYDAAGDPIRGFDFNKLKDEIAVKMLDVGRTIRNGYQWQAFNVSSQQILNDKLVRLDYKYWNPETIQKRKYLHDLASPTLQDLNLISTNRGKSPKAELYVDENDGYALVVKAGSNISKYGELIENGDYVEKNIYDEMEVAHIKLGDILLASTGDGTLGKCCVYRSNKPAIADGHVTIIRVDPNVVYPEYLADYLRLGFGAEQIQQFYTGTTGLIELTPDYVQSIVVDLLSGLEEQQRVSKQLREKEASFQTTFQELQNQLTAARKQFLNPQNI